VDGASELCCCALCLCAAPGAQEHKLQEAHVQEVVRQVGLEGWHTAFNCSVAKKGYSGTATFTR
jgi:exonuclease III